ncbi:MAG: hypothetical protein JNM31_08325 [Flavobacteriales bacterium]|nr:hypothetical protein [Flavobacteriales bacterium]
MMFKGPGIWLIGLGIVLGAVAGWLYWSHVGCSTGSCAITSNPVGSTLYGALLGGLLVDTFRPSSTRAGKDPK